jgi:TolB-like protein
MDLYPGETLQEKLKRGPLSPDEAIGIAVQIARGLTRAHERGIVHRDIKPANILVTDDGTVKILDFGLAKLGAGGMLTRVGTTLGTVAYMSPEQSRGDDVDQRTDIWSLGVILFQMLTGRLPFSAEHEQATVYMIQNADPLAGSTLPDSFQRCLARALQKSPDARYLHASEFAADLRAIRGDPPSGPSRSAGPPVAPAAWKRPALIGGIATLIALLVGGYLIFRPGDGRTGSTQPGGGALTKLAVLPFVNLRSDPQTDFLGFALADQIIGNLSYVRTLIVRPASAVRKYQGQSVEPAVAGRDLDVDLVLTGNYLKEADIIRLSLELVDLQSNAILWRGSLKEEYDDVFKLQDTVARKVADGLRIRFQPEDLQGMRADVPRNPLAYEYYMRGISYPLTEEGNRQAVSMFRASIELDSAFAPAFNELAHRLQQLAAYALGEAALYGDAEVAARRALALNDRLPGPYARLIVLCTESGRTAEAYSFSKKLVEVSPNSAESHFYLGYIYRYVGFLDLARREMETAVQLDPRERRFRSIGITYLYLGDYRKALEGFDRDSSSTFSLGWKGITYALMGERDSALRYLERVIAIEPEGGFGRYSRATKFYVEKKYDLVRAELISQEGLGIVDGENWYNISQQYGLIGDAAGVSRTLRRTIERGFFSYPLMLRDPAFTSVRGDPEVVRVLDLAKARYEAFKDQHPELREMSGSEPL